MVRESTDPLVPAALIPGPGGAEFYAHRHTGEGMARHGLAQAKTIGINVAGGTSLGRDEQMHAGVFPSSATGPAMAAQGFGILLAGEKPCLVRLLLGSGF